MGGYGSTVGTVAVAVEESAFEARFADAMVEESGVADVAGEEARLPNRESRLRTAELIEDWRPVLSKAVA